MKVLCFAALASLASASSTWTRYAYDFDTVAFAIAFSDLDNGFIPYLDASGDVGVKVTHDAGVTWTKTNVTKFSALLMDAAAKGPNGVLGGVADTQFTDDKGNSFSVSKGDKFIGQSCEALRDPADDQFFGVTGQDALGRNGVGISMNGGKNFAFHNVSNAKTHLRYGAFPSKLTWYVTAGTWPQSSQPAPTVIHSLTSRANLHARQGVGHSLEYVLQTPTRATKVGDPGWFAEILKTSDGGKTWESQYYSEGEFYFNGLDCADETHCCAAGESDSPPRPGGRLWCTADGKQWVEVYYVAGADQGMSTVRAISPSEYWAAGGELSKANFHGTFLHSTDGGSTWTNSTLKDMYPNAMAFPDASHGWATTVDRDSQCGIARYG